MGISQAPRLFGGIVSSTLEGQVESKRKSCDALVDQRPCQTGSIPAAVVLRTTKGTGAYPTVSRSDTGARAYRAVSRVCPARPVLVETEVGGGKTADPTPGPCSTKKPSRLFPVGRNLSVTLRTASPANLHASFHYALPAALPAADGLRRHLSSRNAHPAVLRHILTLPLHILGRGLDRGRLRCRGN